MHIPILYPMLTVRTPCFCEMYDLLHSKAIRAYSKSESTGKPHIQDVETKIGDLSK